MSTQEESAGSGTPDDALPPQYRKVARLEGQPSYLAWHVWDLVLLREACLLIEPTQLSDSNRNYGVHREAAILKRLHDTGVVPKLYNFGRFQNRTFLVQELIRGTSLGAMALPLPVSQALQTGANIARALLQIHQGGVIHRDVKLGNIWNAHSLQTLRLQGFNFAVTLDENDLFAVEKANGPALTVAYAAPERISSDPPTPALDSYSLGVSLHEILTGQVPFNGETLSETVYRIMTEPAPDLCVLNPNIPKSVGQLIQKLLAKDPSTRPNLEETAKLLEQLSTGSMHWAEPPPHATTIHPDLLGKAKSSGLNLNLVESVGQLGTGEVFPEVAPSPQLEDQPPELFASLEGDSLASVVLRPGDKQAPEDLSASAVAARDIGATFPPSSTGGFHLSIREGTKLGQYRIVKLIGSGSFGAVYLAEDSLSMLGTQVALKIPKYQGLTPQEVARYQHEAKLWRALSADRHPNVLELKDLNRFDGIIAFVMEFVDGSNLQDFAAETWRAEPFPLKEAIRILHSVAEALRVIHAKRVYHGDLKPSNVLIRLEDKAVKVTDFSISRSVTPQGSVPGEFVAGTPAYMAPEAWAGKPTLQSDLFSLGVMFYELVTGQLPFKAANAAELKQIINEGRLIALPLALRPDLPFELERIILRCLETSLADRYLLVAELIEDLQTVDPGQNLVTQLADCLVQYSTKEDLEFLVKKDLPGRGYRGGDERTLLVEYCLDEEPTQILLSCFSKPGLARLATRVGAVLEEEAASPEQYAQSILRALGLAQSGKPAGIRASVLLIDNLKHRLEQSRDATEVASLVMPAAREYEKVLRDLIRFYGQFLFGRFHERALVKLARDRVAGYKKDLSRATLGDLLTILQALNTHLEGDSAEARQFAKIFRRRYAVRSEYLTDSRVTAGRNAFIHWNETLANAGLAKIRDVAREMLQELGEFLLALEKEDLYPRVVVVESFVTDRFGRKYVYCRNDQGQVEKVFTNMTVDPSRHYFFYPTTNPMRIYPILVPV